jgi:TolB-like protein
LSLRTNSSSTKIAPAIGAHSPRFFNVNCLPFDYDPDAPSPQQWRAFLRQEFRRLKSADRPAVCRILSQLAVTVKRTRSGPLSPRRLSIVVLSFANLSGDPEQEYFVDGVTESFTTDLSRISGSFVIARNRAFSSKGRSIDVRQVGRELNIRYVLEGSVKRNGNRLRVSVQLVNAEPLSTSGPSVSRSPPPICSICRMKLSPGSQTR